MAKFMTPLVEMFKTVNVGFKLLNSNTDVYYVYAPGLLY